MVGVERCVLILRIAEVARATSIVHYAPGSRIDQALRGQMG